MYSNTLNIQLKDEVGFIQNNYSALHLFSSILTIASNSKVVFKENTGYQGGGIHMEGFSSIYLNDNISLIFDSNRAAVKGGAIYHLTPVDPRRFNVRNCFVNYEGHITDVSQRNIRLNFTNNFIGDPSQKIQQCIYTFSAIPCYGINHSDILTALNSKANFIFTNGVSNETIGTAVSNFSIVGELPDVLIPGIEMLLNISVVNDNGIAVEPPIYNVRVETVKGNISIDPAYFIVSNNKIKVYGSAGSKGKIKLGLIDQPKLGLRFNFTLSNCQPGYVILESGLQMCHCSANTKESQYLGIRRCNHTSNEASLTYGYWAGYIKKELVNCSTSYFRTSNCPKGYCRNKIEYYDGDEISLPHSTNELSDIICNNNRHGVICALCKNGTSVHSHTQSTFLCKEETHCNLGILFFILSQIIPVTVLFLIVILFDIQLTTGALNGFLFYAQIFDTLSLNADNFITFPKATQRLLKALNFIVSIFNLKFFNLPTFSYCLFKGANSLDVIAFDYVTVVYSLLLIVFTVVIMNLKCNKLNRLLQKLKGKRVHLSQSIIHGLSGFLVMCYARTTTSTLQLLTPTWLHDEGPKALEVVVYYYGEVKYFHGIHLKYAIPALFALIFMTLLPPLILLLYPLCYKVLALFRLQESKLTRIICRVIPLEKFKPFFDSFQGTFKDNHRYFAGLYFVYRLVPLIIYTVTSKIDFFFYFEIQLILMLVVHAYAQPHKEKRHNRLDLYILTIFLILNSITSYNYQWTVNQLDARKIIPVFSTIQIILAYSPLAIMILYFFVTLKSRTCIKDLKDKFRRQKKDAYDRSALSLSMLDERQDVIETDYRELY